MCTVDKQNAVPGWESKWVTGTVAVPCEGVNMTFDLTCDAYLARVFIRETLDVVCVDVPMKTVDKTIGHVDLDAGSECSGSICEETICSCVDQ